MKLSVLEMSNCSLSADDVTALVKFISENKTLSTLNISHTMIESEDTAKALARALKKHPTLRRVNLAYCKLAGGHSVMDKVLAACKKCDELEIGHNDFDSKCVEKIAQFLGKKHSLTSFSLVGAKVDTSNKKLLSEALTVNKTIQKIRLHSNALQLPAIIRKTKKVTTALSRLTQLDFRFNRFPTQGAKVMASFLEEPSCNLVSLIMSNNHLTTKGINALLPALKKNTSLQQLDLSSNWLNNQCAPAVIDMLLNNSTLLNLNLYNNKSLKARKDGGKPKIVKGALFDVSSLESIAACNHTCAVKMSGCNYGGSHEETIRKVRCVFYDLLNYSYFYHLNIIVLNIFNRSIRSK